MMWCQHKEGEGKGRLVGMKTSHYLPRYGVGCGMVELQQVVKRDELGDQPIAPGSGVGREHKMLR